MDLMTTNPTIASAPGGVPLLGHLPQLVRRPLETFQSLRAHGDVVILRLGRTPAYVVNHPDRIRQILVNDARKFDKGVQAEKARFYVGEGLVTSGEPLHLRQRRLIQPAFHQAQIARYAEIMREGALETILSWRHGQAVPMNDELFSLSLKVLTRTLFSTNFDADVASEFTEATSAFVDGLAVRIALPFEILEKLPIRSNRRFNAGRARMQAIIEQIVAACRIRKTDPTDLLSLLVNTRDDDAGAGITDGQIHDEIMTMLIAGTETTANTLSWTCHLLGQHPDIQARLQAEVHEVLGERPIGAGDLRRLTYTRQVLAEVLRMYPAVWLLSRRPITDVEIGAYRIPAGSHVLFCPYALHRDPELYPEPERFHPDRWLGEKTDSKDSAREAYIPFGAGMRGCIGEPYAWAQMMIFLSTLVTSWRLRPAPGQIVRPVARASLRPDQLSMIVEARGSEVERNSAQQHC
jgi:cytochrome P450